MMVIIKFDKLYYFTLTKLTVMEQPSILEPLEKEITIERRKLLPLWIKIFIWMFMIFGGFAVLAFIAGLLSVRFEGSLYGLETNDPLSITGIFIFSLFLLKGIVAFSLWTEKSFAVHLGIADALIGIAVCVAVMVYPSLHPEARFSFRLELMLLIPYLIKLFSIKNAWLGASQRYY